MARGTAPIDQGIARQAEPGSVAAVRQWVSAIDVEALSDRERLDLVADLERLKHTAAATQTRATHALRESREVSRPQDAVRSVGSEVALARRTSPTLGDRFVGLARALVDEMPFTMHALRSGTCSEDHALVMVQATSVLTLEHRAEVDRRVGPLLGRLGVRGAERAARRVAQELDVASVLKRMQDAVRSRRVTTRPAPDGMAYLTVLGPMVDVVGAAASLRRHAQSVVSGRCPQQMPEGRGIGAVEADTALRLLSGREVEQPQPVEVHLVMTDRSLLGSGEQGRSVMEPARLPGHGPVPAPVARAWVRGDSGGRFEEGSAAGPEGQGVRTASRPAGGAASDPADAAASAPADGTMGNGPADGGAGGAATVWLRRLYTSPDGRDLVAMDSRRRHFTGQLRRMLVLRDDVCRTPWCEAPIMHADHTVPARDEGATSFAQGAGRCARCNFVKEAPGWRATVVAESAAPPPESGDRGRATGPPPANEANRANEGNQAHQGNRGQRANQGNRATRAFEPNDRGILNGPPPSDLPTQPIGRSGGSAAPRLPEPHGWLGTQRPGVRLTTPLGHSYESYPPPLLGWGASPTPATSTPSAPSGISPATPRRSAHHRIPAHRDPDRARRRVLSRAGLRPHRLRPTGHLERTLNRLLR